MKETWRRESCMRNKDRCWLKLLIEWIGKGSEWGDIEDMRNKVRVPFFHLQIAILQEEAYVLLLLHCVVHKELTQDQTLFAAFFVLQCPSSIPYPLLIAFLFPPFILFLTSHKQFFFKNKSLIIAFRSSLVYSLLV